jgi:hypothetical protein
MSHPLPGSPHWVKLIQPGCGSRACLARQVIGRPSSRPQASRDCISHPKLASSESRMCLPPEVGFGRDGIASPGRGRPWARRNYVPPPRAGIERNRTVSPFRYAGHCRDFDDEVSTTGVDCPHTSVGGCLGQYVTMYRLTLSGPFDIVSEARTWFGDDPSCHVDAGP